MKALSVLAAAIMLAACTEQQTAPSSRPAASTPGLSANLQRLALPAGVCEADAPSLALENARGGYASERLRSQYDDPSFVVRLQEPPSAVEGDLTGDGYDEVAVVLVCEGFGGGSCPSRTSRC